MKIDTSKWEEFIIGNLFEKCDLKCKKANFNKAIDCSEIQDEEFSLPLVNAKHTNNGIQFYGRTREWDAEEMTLDIVSNGAVATGDVYAQPQRTGVLWDAYLVKPLFECSSEYILHFLACVVQRCVKQYFSWNDKCTWDKVKTKTVLLPVKSSGEPDWDYMEMFMREIDKEVKNSLVRLQSTSTKKIKKLDTTNWGEFLVSRLFEIKSPAKRSIKLYDDGTIPYVSSGSVNNGIISYLKSKDDEDIEKGGCITVSPLDGSSFYQEQDFLGRGGAGSAISLLYNENLTKYNALFICTIIKASAYRFGYNDALTSDNLKMLKLKLPIKCDKDGAYSIDRDKKYSDEGVMPDWDYMEEYMKRAEKKARGRMAKLL